MLKLESENFSAVASPHNKAHSLSVICLRGQRYPSVFSPIPCNLQEIVLVCCGGKGELA